LCNRALKSTPPFLSVAQQRQDEKENVQVAISTAAGAWAFVPRFPIRPNHKDA
jgi:hypothetical protein